MSYEEIQLLFKDLCSRIPHGVAYRWEGKEGEDDLPHFLNGMNEWMIFYIQNGNIKPYLRSMEDMTEKERNEYLSLKMQECERVALAEVYRPEAISIVMDWLNAHHFDYRGLIKRGLATRVTKNNNPYD